MNFNLQKNSTYIENNIAMKFKKIIVLGHIMYIKSTVYECEEHERQREHDVHT